MENRIRQNREFEEAIVEYDAKLEWRKISKERKRIEEIETRRRQK